MQVATRNTNSAAPSGDGNSAGDNKAPDVDKDTTSTSTSTTESSTSNDGSAESVKTESTTVTTTVTGAGTVAAPKAIPVAPTSLPSSPALNLQFKLVSDLQEARATSKSEEEFSAKAQKIYTEILSEAEKHQTSAQGEPAPEQKPRTFQDYGIPLGYPVPANLLSDPARASEMLSGQLANYNPTQARFAPPPQQAHNPFAAADGDGKEPKLSQVLAMLGQAITGQRIPQPPTYGMDMTVPGGKYYDPIQGALVDAHNRLVPEARLSKFDKQAVEAQASRRGLFARTDGTLVVAMSELPDSEAD